MTEISKEELNGFGARVNKHESRIDCQDVKIGFMETSIKDFKDDVSTLFRVITDLRIENKAMATRGLIWQTILLIALQAGLAYWLKK